MSTTEQKRLSSFLFDREDVEVLDIKFLRGFGGDLSEEVLCATAREVLADFFTNPKEGTLPSGRSEQRPVAEIFANH